MSFPGECAVALLRLLLGLRVPSMNALWLTVGAGTELAPCYLSHRSVLGTQMT